jgi:predicted nucleic acid-binding protein
MIVKPFVDTNVLLYAYDKAAGMRHETARLVIRALWEQGGAVLSTQVLQEFYVNVTRKIPKPLSPAAARGILSGYCAWQVEQARCDTVLRASEVQERHRLSFWDGLIVAAAAQGGADVLLSEDLNAGQVIEGVRVVDPFDETDPMLHQLLGNRIADGRATYPESPNT